MNTHSYFYNKYRIHIPKRPIFTPFGKTSCHLNDFLIYLHRNRLPVYNAPGLTLLICKCSNKTSIMVWSARCSCWRWWLSAPCNVSQQATALCTTASGAWRSTTVSAGCLWRLHRSSACFCSGFSVQEPQIPLLPSWPRFSCYTISNVLSSFRCLYAAKAVCRWPSSWWVSYSTWWTATW